MSELGPDTESTELRSSSTPTLSGSDEIGTKDDSAIESWTDVEIEETPQVSKIQNLLTPTMSELTRWSKQL